jgi:predicted RNA binding protein YcfA (HicA-like mRNA interferase family)
VKGKQLLRRLRKLGVEVDERRGKGGHVLLRYRGRQSVLPTHGDTDLGPVLIRRICRQLGIDPDEVL